MQRCSLPQQISKKPKPSTKCTLFQRRCQVLFSEMLRHQTDRNEREAVWRDQEFGIGCFG